LFRSNFQPNSSLIGFVSIQPSSGVSILLGKDAIFLPFANDEPRSVFTLINTGSQASLITMDTAKILGLKMIPSEPITLRGIVESQMKSQPFQTTARIRLSDGNLFHATFHVVDRIAGQVASLINIPDNQEALNQVEFEKHVVYKEPQAILGVDYHSYLRLESLDKPLSCGLQPYKSTIGILLSGKLRKTHQSLNFAQVSSHQSTAQSIGVSSPLGSNQTEILASKPLAVQRATNQSFNRQPSYFSVRESSQSKRKASITQFVNAVSSVSDKDRDQSSEEPSSFQHSQDEQQVYEPTRAQPFSAGSQIFDRQGSTLPVTQATRRSQNRNRNRNRQSRNSTLVEAVSSADHNELEKSIEASYSSGQSQSDTNAEDQHFSMNFQAINRRQQRSFSYPQAGCRKRQKFIQSRVKTASSVGDSFTSNFAKAVLSAYDHDSPNAQASSPQASRKHSILFVTFSAEQKVKKAMRIWIDFCDGISIGHVSLSAISNQSELFVGTQIHLQPSSQGGECGERCSHKK
jgi:hypothetical protein